MKISVAIALLAAIAPACGWGEEAPKTEAGPVSLEPCPTSGQFPHGGGWGAKVSDISCREVGKFIQYRFFKALAAHSRQTHEPYLQGGGGARHVDGYACKYTEYASQRSWYHLSCEKGAQRFTWNFTS